MENTKKFVNLDNSPDLSMANITEHLFDNEYLSDVQYIVTGRTIYAHSWELKKRSEIFRNHFKVGDKVAWKWPIVNTIEYKVFYEFLKFIYTDNCNIVPETAGDLLKLAVCYKIVKLETKILNYSSLEQSKVLRSVLDFSDYTVYHLGINSSIYWLLTMINDFSLFSKHPSLVKAILRSDYTDDKTSEFELFCWIVDWLDQWCNLVNQIPFEKHKSIYNDFIKLIRFPTMTLKDFNRCLKKHANILSDNDISTILDQMSSGSLNHGIWNSQPRIKLNYVQKPMSENHRWASTFTVACDLILYGLRYGNGPANFEIQILSRDLITNATDMLSFGFNLDGNYDNLISLGEAVKLKPNVEYTIVKVASTNGNAHKKPYYRARKFRTKLIVTGPSHFVYFTQESDNLLEIFFRVPTQ